MDMFTKLWCTGNKLEASALLQFLSVSYYCSSFPYNISLYFCQILTLLLILQQQSHHCSFSSKDANHKFLVFFCTLNPLGWGSHWLLPLRFFFIFIIISFLLWGDHSTVACSIRACLNFIIISLAMEWNASLKLVNWLYVSHHQSSMWMLGGALHHSPDSSN